MPPHGGLTSGLLIVDEDGYIAFEQDAGNLFFQLVPARYAHASLILTSNLASSRWAGSQLPPGPQPAESMGGRPEVISTDQTLPGRRRRDSPREPPWRDARVMPFPGGIGVSGGGRERASPDRSASRWT
jgi:hypothetical protein